MVVTVQIREDVREALSRGEPVVALESTIITHGMPYPQNLETALAVEAIVRGEGCVPCTVAVIDGVLIAGVDQQQLRHIAQAKGTKKISSRDLPFAAAMKYSGGTTVSGTLAACEAAGIRVFVTGGIGGVHRGGEISMDVSADLDAVASSRSSACVVCAGAKNILDVPRTLEALETRGVPVATLGSEEFPAFYVSKSGVPSPATLPDIDAAARAVSALGRLNKARSHACGMVLAVPIPAADEAAGGAEINAAIDRALLELNSKGSHPGSGGNDSGSKGSQGSQGSHNNISTGRDVTPFLLARVAELTQGRSLRSNIALVKNNARVGAAMARRLADMEAARPRL